MSFSVSPSDFEQTYFVCMQIGPNNFIPLAQVNPIYCLSPAAAQALVAELADVQPFIPLAQASPEGPVFGFYVVKNNAGPDTVPYLKLTGASGKAFLVNAGLIANYWNHGYPADFAHKSAVADLTNQIASN